VPVATTAAAAAAAAAAASTTEPLGDAAQGRGRDGRCLRFTEAASRGQQAGWGGGGDALGRVTTLAQAKAQRRG